MNVILENRWRVEANYKNTAQKGGEQKLQPPCADGPKACRSGNIKG